MLLTRPALDHKHFLHLSAPFLPCQNLLAEGATPGYSGVAHWSKATAFFV